MEILNAIGLFVVILLGLNHMAGGKPDSILRPVLGIASSIVRTLLSLALSLIGQFIGLLCTLSMNALSNRTHRLPNQRRRPAE